MRPVVFTIPGLNWNVPGYGLMLMLGLFIAIWWAARRAFKSGGNPDVILNCGFIAIIGGVVGSRAMYVIHYWEHFANQGSLGRVIWSIIDVSKGGLEFYGGFILTIVATLVWLRYFEKVSLRWYMDIIAPSAALGLALGRLGCFLNGCCFGTTCELPWGVRFPFGSSACVHQWQNHVPGSEIREELLYADPLTGVSMPLTRDILFAAPGKIEKIAKVWNELREIEQKIDGTADAGERTRLQLKRDEIVKRAGGDLNFYGPTCLNMHKYGLTAAEIRALAEPYRARPVHPTQLYSTITAGLIALFLNALYWRRGRDGQVICTLLLIEPAARMLLEMLRADNPVDTVGRFTISQFLAIVMTLVGLLGLIALRKMSPRSPRARLWEPPPAEIADKKKKSAPQAN